MVIPYPKTPEKASLMNIFYREPFHSWVRALNRWVHRHSADPTTPYLTEAVRYRESMQDILANWPMIRDELDRSATWATPIQGDLFFGEDITEDGKWRKVYIYWYGKYGRMADRFFFPGLVGAIRRHRDIRLAMVSVLEPGGRIKAHTGPWSGSIRVHITAISPNDPACFIVVGGEKYWWKDNDFVAFDDTYEHYVENNTGYPRIILFLDIERKMKSVWSQSVVRLINSTLGRLTAR
jgi:beta-hydroxylase